MSIMLANGEYAKLVDKWKTYDYARDTGVQEFAETQTKTTFNRTRTMVPRGLATYIEIPESLARRVDPNDPYDRTAGYLQRTTDDLAKMYGAATRYWTGGLLRPTEAAVRKALDDVEARLAELEGADEHDDEMLVDVRDSGSPTIEQLVEQLDLSKCEKQGPILFVHGKTVRFEGTDKDESLPFLASLYDPHAYGFSATDPSKAHQVRPGFRGTATGYITEGYETD